MTDLLNAARQTKARAKKRKGKAAMRRARKAKPYQRAALPAPERIRARTKTERFDVDADREWIVVRSEPNRALRCAQAIREAGLPVFEARQEERVVAENGKARVAQIPLLRRLMFVGLAAGEEVADLWPVINLESVWCRGDGTWVWTPREWIRGSLPIRIGPLAMQKFADHITGHRVDGEFTPDLIKALFSVGEKVTITDGPFVTYGGFVERVDASRSRYTVASKIFGRETLIELDEKQLEAA